MQLNTFSFKDTSDKKVVKLFLFTNDMSKRGFTKPATRLINKAEKEATKARLLAQGLTEAC